MTHNPEQADFYADEGRLAIHLEMEWSDVLFAPVHGTGSAPKDTSEWPNPLVHRTRPAFYQSVCERVCGWLAARGASPISYCDVGGGAGRTMYEIARALPALEELVLIEPSKNLARWAQHMLAGTEGLRAFPALSGLWEVENRPLTATPEPLRDVSRRLRVHVDVVEAVAIPDGSFQLITCLNVVDRHPDPRALLARLRRMVAPGGLLVLASPLDFRERLTPRPNWIDDLAQLFDPGEWVMAGEAEIPMDVRASPRYWTRYMAQVKAGFKVP